MYQKICGIIQTLAPLHVGATAGEENGNLNLIFRDAFTQTGIIPGSSIRGRLRAEMRQATSEEEAGYWYGNRAITGETDSTTESRVKLEHASIVWLPVFCPGQPIVWVSCPRLLRRYQRIAGDLVKLKDGTLLKEATLPDAYTRSNKLQPLNVNDQEKLFFNFGLLTIEQKADLSAWFPLGEELPAVIVADNEIGMVHDMALYRQSRVCLEDDEKKVKQGQFFNTEALPEDTILVFAAALRKEQSEKKWQPLNGDNPASIYLGGLESIGFGNCFLSFLGLETP